MVPRHPPNALTSLTTRKLVPSRSSLPRGRWSAPGSPRVVACRQMFKSMSLRRWLSGEGLVPSGLTSVLCRRIDLPPPPGMRTAAEPPSRRMMAIPDASGDPRSHRRGGAVWLFWSPDDSSDFAHSLLAPVLAVTLAGRRSASGSSSLLGHGLATWPELVCLLVLRSTIQFSRSSRKRCLRSRSGPRKT